MHAEHPASSLPASAGDPWVKGFDKSLQRFKGQPGQRLDVCSSRDFSLTGLLKRVSASGATALQSISFRWADSILVSAEGSQMAVWLNGRPVQAGSTMKMAGGQLRFLAPRPRMNHFVGIEQPGIGIRVLQPFSKERGAYASWLDVWVTLTAPPTSALTGILGRTFRAGAISAASAAPLVAGLASEP